MSVDIRGDWTTCFDTEAILKHHFVSRNMPQSEQPSTSIGLYADLHEATELYNP